ncbi:MAG: cob(I)yrinic acid a,c-diamide adenosyltransferase [Planctomycetota bacterium]|nr:MAG: cob(I)yrinic acid a,c-diamide adenosyltransferase [Planctomycetota bacterium]
MKIYTKTGDDGTTGLFAGPRVSKDDVRISAYGTVDELNACLGWVLTQIPQSPVDNAAKIDQAFTQILTQIQSDLFAAGAQLATPDAAQRGMCLLEPSDIRRLEGWIDAAEESLPPLQNFILPGGTPLAAALHMARTVCRRAEREVVRLSHSLGGGGEIETVVGYLNRLSDLLFVAARLANHLSGIDDVPWPGRASSGRSGT